jgi:uncharacterized membrane protein YbjE (DUF340 family)
MSGLLEIFVLLAFIAGGYVLARFIAAPKPRLTDLLLKAALWALLLVMGYRIGSQRDLVARLGELGLLALASAFLAVAGTILALFLVEPLIRKSRAGARSRHYPGQDDDGGARTHDASDGKEGSRALGKGLGHFKAPLLLLGLVAAGFAIGLWLPRPEWLDLDAICGWALKALLFFIGMQFAQAKLSLKESLLDPAIFLIPLATALGSLASGLLLMPLFDLRLGAALSLQAGFGWYSLSGILISGLGDPALGSASFLSNMARESLAFVLIPFLGASGRPWLAIGTGGATAMDVTLPIVEQCAGPEWVPASFTSGAILSILVPVLVPALFAL